MPAITSRIMSSIPSKIISVSNGNLNTAIIEAIESLKRGLVIAIPTDTIYGVAVDATNSKTIHRLYDIKQRDPNKPIAICVSDIDNIYKWCDVSCDREVLESLLPGQVTVVFRRLPVLNCDLNPGNPLIGVRIPNHDFVRLLCQGFDRPIALTSANVSNGPSSANIDEFKELWPRIDRVFDGGDLTKHDPTKTGSTVIDLSIAGHYSIIRSGCSLDFVRKVMNRFNIKTR